MIHLVPTLLVLAAAPERLDVDAFLADHTHRELVDPRELTAAGRQTYQRSLVSAHEERFGVPTFLWAQRPVDGTRSYRAMGLTAEQAARRYLLDYAELYRASGNQWARARAEHVHDLGDGAVIVSFEQDVKGVRVFRDELKVIMNSQLELVALSGYLTPQLGTSGTFALSEASAVASAYAVLTGHALDAGALSPLENAWGYSRFTVADEPTPARARAVWFALPGGLEPAFAVELTLSNGETSSELFSCVISAKNGALLARHSMTTADAYSYRVWADPTTKFPADGPQGTAASPHPTGSPNKFRPTFVPNSLISLANGPISTNDPWLAPGALSTSGNNVKAYCDLKKPDGFSGGDVMGSTSTAGVFDYQYDLTQKPGSQPQQLASLTQIFYVTNWLHDWFYDVGFDEKSGNAQISNLGRGGSASDPLLAEGQDYGGKDNANMSAPADGASPRMQMYVWDSAPSLSLSVGGKNYDVTGAAFGPQDFNVTAPMQLVAGVANSSLIDACAAIQSVAGKIALIERGNCTFIAKVQAAAKAGAVGVIIFDNQDTDPTPRLGGTGNISIPSVGTSMANGAALRGLEGSDATLVSASTVDPDGTIDNTIVAHEWGHYLSKRLIGNGNGLGNLQAGGMGEGWSDIIAMLMVVRAEDTAVASNTTFNGAYALASYALGALLPEAYYYGIRRFPYSTDTSKNGLTFKHIQPAFVLPGTAAFGQDGADNDEVHNTGEVWATMLWECYASLLNDKRYTFDQARDRMRAYIVASYKATPLLPTILEARDALLAVAAAKDTGDYELFWKAFAKRGAGMGATGPNRDSPDNTPVSESSAVGNSLIITDLKVDDGTTSCDKDGHLDANEAGFVNVTVQNVGIGTITGAQLTVSSKLPMLTFPSGTTATVPDTQPFKTAVVKVPVALGSVAGVQTGSITASVALASLVKTPVVNEVNVRLNYDTQANATRTDDVESDMSLWSTGADMKGDTTTPFRIYADTVNSHWWYGPSSGFNSDTYLISPPLEVATGIDFVFAFKHRYDFETVTDTTANLTVNYDGAIIELSTDDGATWSDIGGSAVPAYSGVVNTGDGDKQSSNTLDGKKSFVGRSDKYPAFIAETVNLHTQYAGQTVRVRFHIATDDAISNKGWEIDDIAFTGIVNKPFTAIISDPNTCNNKVPVVTMGPDQEVSEGAAVKLVATATDPDNDPLTLTWHQVSGGLVTLDAMNGFTAPATKSNVLMIFELTVSDGRAVVGPLTQKVLVKTNNKAPVATAPATVTAKEQTHVTIAGTATDPDGDPLTYQWTQLAGPEVAFTDGAAATLEFDAPKVDADTTISLQFVAKDPGLSSEPVKVDVLVKHSACGCNSFEGSLIGLAGVVMMLRRRRSR